MAKFTDLSNELVIAIASFIRKPTDILHLCIAERRSYGLIGPLLYENIVLHHNDYFGRGVRYYQRSRKMQHSVLRRLHMKFDKDRRGGNERKRGNESRALAINTGERLSFASHEVLRIGSLTPFLRNLSLIICVREDISRQNGEFDIEAVGEALQPFRHGLETLTLYIGGKDHCYGLDMGIGSLHEFKAMKKLCIQSKILLGWSGTFDWSSDTPPLLKSSNTPPLLSQLLPPNLEDLTIHCCESREYRSNEQEVPHHVEVPLDGKSFITRTLEPSERLAGEDRRVIDSVVVCLLGDPEIGHACRVPDCRSSKLRNSFDIVGRRVDSGVMK